MKITKMTYFVKGIVDILLSLIMVCVIIKNHNGLLPRSIIALMLLCLGISEIVGSIETKAQRLRRTEELEALAELYGWNRKEEDSEP